MIATGLCMMGGCFAQNAGAACVDSYWGAEKVAIPQYYANGSLGLYEYADVPVGVLPEKSYLFTRQKWKSGYISLFYIFQNNEDMYNIFTQGKMLSLRSRQGENLFKLDADITKEPLISVHIDADGLSSNYGAVSPSSWNPLLPGSRLRLLDARNGEKDFHVSYGAWGHKWYLLPMKSPCDTTAVYDVEAKTLVEL